MNRPPGNSPEKRREQAQFRHKVSAPNRKSPHPSRAARTLSILLCFVLLIACVGFEAPLATAPQDASVLVTSNQRPSLTPFQPSKITPLPSWTPAPPPTATIAPSATASATLPPTDTPVPTGTNTLAPTSALTPTASSVADTPNAPSTPATQNPQYLLNVLMNYAGHTLTVSEVILYPNQSSDTLGSLMLAVNPNLWNNVFVLQSLALNDQPWSNYTLQGQYFTVNLDTPLQPGGIVKLGIAYTLQLPYSAGTFQNFGYTARQINLIDWFPFVVPYLPGQGWVLHDPWAYGENLVYAEADFRVSLTFADPAHAPVVAASAPAGVDSAGALVYVLPNARTFTISASTQYQRTSASVDDVTIDNYYFPEDASAAAMVLRQTRNAVDTYTQAFGPYAHTSLAVVETDLNDGLESDGLYFLSESFYKAYDGSVANDLVDIAVHETAHQWWFGAVASDQALEPWLDEAMATYSEHIFYEKNAPNLVTWWWNFRVYYFTPGGYVDTRLYNTASFRSYVNAVYLRGAEFFEALRTRIGDPAFFAFLQDYYATERGHISNADDFFRILDAHTNVDYSDLVHAYFYYR